MLQGKGSLHLEDIQIKINSVTSGMENMADVVAKHREDIFSILKDNLAEKQGDEDILEKLENTLEEKKKVFTEKLGEKQTDGIDLTKNDELVTFWENNLSKPATKNEVSDKDKTVLSNKVNGLINNLVKLEFNKKGNQTQRQLFKGNSLDVTKMDEVLKDPDMKKILDSKDKNELSNNINTLVNKVGSNGHPFFIHLRHLYDRDVEGKVALRSAIFLFQIYNIVKDNTHNIDTLTKAKIEKILDQIENKDIPQIKGIHNVKMELDKVNPMHETLRDINTKKGDVDLGTHKLGDQFDHELTSDFENGKAVDLDEYRISDTGVRIGSHTVKLFDAGGRPKKDIKVGLDQQDTLDIYIDQGGSDIKIGTLVIDNKENSTSSGGNKIANLIWKGDNSNISKLNGQLPLDLELDVLGIKNVKSLTNQKCGQVGLTKTYKFKLEEGGGPIPPPPVITGTLDDELDVNFSDMKQTMKDISDERTYNQDSKEYVEALKNKNTKFGKMLVAAKQAMLGDFFRMRKYKKELKDMDGKKKGLNVRGDWANVAKVHGGQGLKSVMELTQVSHPVVYQEISNLALDYYGGGSTMSDIQFEKKLKKIFTDAKPLVEELKSKGVSIDKSASDILQSLQIQKAQNQLTYQVSEAVANALGSRSSLPAPEADALANNISTLFKNFTQTNKIVPQLFTHYNKLNSGNTINLNDTYENISKKMVAHLDSLTMVAAQSMTNRVKLNIKFLADGHSTDNIEAKKGEKQSRWNPAAKLGNIMYGKGYKWRRFPTKVLATGGTVALGTLLLGPLGGIVAGSVVAGSLAAGKKAAQTQRKKHSVEKEYIKDRDNKTNMMNQEDLMKLKYLDDIGNYKEIKTELERILKQPFLSDTEQDNLVGLLSRIMAGFKYQKETGHNAFSLKNKVSTSRPEADEITREKNYNEAMSDLYKLKELSLKRLQLQDVNLTEDDIRNEAQYDSYLSGYKGDFKKFLKLFKKERRKEMRKTGGRTAAIHGAVGGITLGLAHFLDRAGGDVDIDTSETPDTGDVSDVTTPETALPTESIEDLGDANILYDLGKFEASLDFSKDIADQLSNMSSDSGTINVDYFAGVDGTPASASSFTMDIIEDKASNIESILNSGDFSQETIDNVKQVISDDNIKELIKFAQTNNADAGNQNLFALRNLEGIEELLKQVDGKSDINLEFNFSDANSTIGHTSYIPQDRMTGIDLEAIVKETPDISTPPDTPDSPIPDPGTKSGGTSWRGGQGVYTEDNTHKGQDNI